MREARTEKDQAELMLDFGQILVVIVSLLKGQEETQSEGMVTVAASQKQIVDYLVGVVEESYNDKLHQELVGLVAEIRDELGLL